ncbi:MAG: hypothetical protein HOW73_30930 [Polyangiaceae bacterium]|nr:hypothetical protein [Polyangiaceae bacterium]
MTTLIGEYFSPWTEKARWALDHHGVKHEYREHVPLLGEPLLRVRARQLGGRVSVPLLVSSEQILRDSFDIAQHADRMGSGSSLFPREHLTEVSAWNQRSEAALRAARALYLGRVLGSPGAQLEMQPAFLPQALRKASVPATGLAIAFLRRKYGISAAAEDEHESSLARELDALREALGSKGGGYLVGDRVTYADVAMAVTLQFVSPVADRHVPLGPATRASCVHERLAKRYLDLIAWRDALYERHRGASSW